MTKTRFIDMTRGSLWKGILFYAAPLILSNTISLLYGAVDMVIVGQFSGSDAMASVGATTSIINLLQTFFMGIAIGVSAVAARRYGAKDEEGFDRVLHSTTLFAILLGFTLFAIGQLICRPLLLALGTPEGPVLQGAELYMRIVFLGKPALLLHSFNAAILRSVGDSRRPLYISLLSGAVNVLLNLVFVIVFDMSVAGVATATTISCWLSLFLFFRAIKDPNNPFTFSFRRMRLYKAEILSVLKVGLPSAIQASFLSFSNVCIQSSVNSFGAAAIAGNAAAGNIESFVVGIKTSFNNATLTAVSQNYGAKNAGRVKKSLRVAMTVGIAGSILLSLLLFTFSHELLGLYLPKDEEAIGYGTIRLQVTMLLYFISMAMDLLTYYLRGIGYSILSALNALLGIAVFRVIWVFGVFPLIGTFASLYLCWPISWTLCLLMNLVTILFVQKKAMAKMKTDTI